MGWISGLRARYNGAKAEAKAKAYLLKHGLVFIQANYRCQTGEIDLVMKDKDQWVFVEVKSRQNDEFGLASEYFTAHKKAKVLRAINHYLMVHELNPYNTLYRIDVIAITGGEVEWYQAV